jgi:hypothetical protein
MARTPTAVASFLSALATDLRPLADADLASLHARKLVRSSSGGSGSSIECCCRGKESAGAGAVRLWSSPGWGWGASGYGAALPGLLDVPVYATLCPRAGGGGCGQRPAVNVRLQVRLCSVHVLYRAA